MNHDAIYALYPQAVKILNDIVYDSFENVIDIDIEAVNNWSNPNAYIIRRLEDYPSIGDQLDSLFHAGVFPEEMASKIQAVKDTHPKPTLEE